MYMCAHSACRKAERRYARRDRCDGDCVGGEQTLEFPHPAVGLRRCDATMVADDRVGSLQQAVHSKPDRLDAAVDSPVAKSKPRRVTR